jgi:hypothetical protein
MGLDQREEVRSRMPEVAAAAIDLDQLRGNLPDQNLAAA